MSHGRGFIVVGLDQTPASRAALDFALREGLLRRVGVEVVTAWLWNTPYEGLPQARTVQEGQAAAEQLQDESLKRAVDGLPARPVIAREVVHEYAGRALVARSEGALMLVVGSRRRSSGPRSMTSSVSWYCARHATVPVVVVPDPADVELQSGATVLSSAGAVH
jgi:nucleotide-binding universal stress UspA family protein